MKKLIVILALTLTAALTCGLLACGRSNPDSANGKFDELTTTESVYGFSAASAGILISSMSDGAVQPAQMKALSRTSVQAPSETLPNREGRAAASDAPDIAELNRYMALVESLLSDGGFQVQSQTSDRPEYGEKMVVSYRDMQGNTLQYTMYYNQILVEAKDWDDDEDDEETYAIEGVMTVEGTDYEIRGERKNESEPGESESETEFRVRLSETRYMTVEQSLETEDGETEQEYSYSIFENRKLVEKSSFSYESERGEDELKMRSFRDGQSQTLYFERETVRGEERIRLRIGEGQNSRSYIVRIETDESGNRRYTYSPAHA